MRRPILKPWPPMAIPWADIIVGGVLALAMVASLVVLLKPF